MRPRSATNRSPARISSCRDLHSNPWRVILADHCPISFAIRTQAAMLRWWARKLPHTKQIDRHPSVHYDASQIDRGNIQGGEDTNATFVAIRCILGTMETET